MIDSMMVCSRLLGAEESKQAEEILALIDEVRAVDVTTGNLMMTLADNLVRINSSLAMYGLDTPTHRVNWNLS